MPTQTVTLYVPSTRRASVCLAVCAGQPECMPERLRGCVFVCVSQSLEVGNIDQVLNDEHHIMTAEAILVLVTISAYLIAYALSLSFSCSLSLFLFLSLSLYWSLSLSLSLSPSSAISANWQDRRQRYSDTDANAQTTKEMGMQQNKDIGRQIIRQTRRRTTINE